MRVLVPGAGLDPGGMTVLGAASMHLIDRQGRTAAAADRDNFALCPSFFPVSFTYANLFPCDA